MRINESFPHPCRRRNLVGLELVLDERAAVGKAALADGAVEGQRGGGAELAVRFELTSIRNHCTTLAGADKPFDWELQTITEMRKIKM